MFNSQVNENDFAFLSPLSPQKKSCFLNFYIYSERVMKLEPCNKLFSLIWLQMLSK